MSINTSIPLLIIKDRTLRSERVGGKFRWAVCTDGSEKSFQAFHVLAKLIDKSRDEVIAITVQTTNMDIAAVQAHITKHFESEGVKKT